MSAPVYRRVLLKLSGEALRGEEPSGVDPKILRNLAQEIKELTQLGIQLALVVGAGNIFRGAGLIASGMERVTADQIGMLATVINSLALQDALQQVGLAARVLCARPIESVGEPYHHQQAIDHLQQGRVVILAGGTGNPFFTTDTAASLRAIEINADLLIKATKVDGVYSADPVRNPQAERFSKLSYHEAVSRELAVMDLTALILCRDYRLPLRVIKLHKAGSLRRAVNGEEEGTYVGDK